MFLPTKQRRLVLVIVPELGELSCSEDKRDKFETFLGLLEDTFGEKKIRLCEVIALITQSRGNLARSQGIGLKLLAKALYRGEFGYLEGADDVTVTPCLGDIEKFHKYEQSRTKAPQDFSEYRVVEFVKGKAIAYSNPEKKKIDGKKTVTLDPAKKVSDKRKKQRKPRVEVVSADNNSIELVIPAKNINWDKREQAVEWLEKYLGDSVEVSGNSWVVSLEFAALFLICGEYNPRAKNNKVAELLKNNTLPESYQPAKSQEKLSKVTEELEEVTGELGTVKGDFEEVTEELATVKGEVEELKEALKASNKALEEAIKGREEVAEELGKANEKIKELETKGKEQLANFEKDNLAQKAEVRKIASTHKKSCTAWAHLLKYMLMAQLQLMGEIKQQKETISEQAVKLDVYSEKDRLVLENAPDLKEFWDLVVDTFKQEMVSPSKALYSVREFVENSSRLVVKQGSYRKVRILEVDGFDNMPVDEDDIKTIGKPMGSIFRCLLNKSPKTSGANLYPESYSKLCQWFAYKCSRYNPKQWFPSSDKLRFSVETGELGKYNIPKRNYLSNEELINLPTLGAAA